MEKTYSGKHYETGESIRVHTNKGLIKSIESTDEDLDNFIAPGLIDIQVNGYAGIGFTHPELSIDKIREVAIKMQKIGVTTFLPTLITAPEKILLANLRTIREACIDPFIASFIPGIHLEGPFISPLDGYRGSHNLKWVLPPDLETFKRLQDAAGGRIIQLTLAPEREGAMDLIHYCQSKGTIVGLAHHNANAKQIHTAVETGARLAVHLGNGIANTMSRHENPIWPQLANNNLMISMIADGFHLTRDEMITFYKAKGRERVILTSDCTDLAGLTPGPYLWDGKEVILEAEGVIRYPEQNVLAGAASPLIRDLGIMKKCIGCTWSEVINMATLNPAGLLGLHNRGEIKAGNKADLILFQIADDKIKLLQTIKKAG